MKLLLTLDFPPEQGGIQKYLFEKAAHTFGADDCIAVGARRRIERRYAELRCAVTWHANILSPLNKKWSIVNLFFHLLSMKKKGMSSVDIECGNVSAAIAPWLLSLVRPVHYCVYAHGTELLGMRKPSLRGLVLRRVLRGAEKSFATGPYVAELLRTAGFTGSIVIDPPRIKLSPEPFRQSSCDGTARLLSVGRLLPHKGHAVFIEACAALPAALEWQALIVGAGPEERRLRMLVDKFRLSGRIAIKTDADDAALAAEFRRAGVFVLPSIETAHGVEGFGIVLLEAMAAGVPVVASNSGGVPAVLDNGSCGVLVDPGNARALRDAIVCLWGDTEKRQRLAANAYRRVREHYAW